jgi:hypothetical protein
VRTFKCLVVACLLAGCGGSQVSPQTEPKPQEPQAPPPTVKEQPRLEDVNRKIVQEWLEGVKHEKKSDLLRSAKLVIEDGQ